MALNYDSIAKLTEQIKHEFPAIAEVDVISYVSPHIGPSLRIECRLKPPFKEIIVVAFPFSLETAGWKNADKYVIHSIGKYYKKVILDTVHKGVKEYPQGFKFHGLPQVYGAKMDFGFMDEMPPMLSPASAEELYNYFKAGAQPKVLPQAALQKVVPGLDATVQCPEHNCSSLSSLWMLIQHMNDVHKWAFGAIADWLETLDVDIKFTDIKAV